MEDKEQIWWRIQITHPDGTQYLMGSSCDKLNYRKNTRNKFAIVRFETKMYLEN